MFVMPGEKYDQKEEIATGSFAFVNRCIEKATGREYAVKWCGLIGWISNTNFILRFKFYVLSLFIFLSSA